MLNELKEHPKIDPLGLDWLEQLELYKRLRRFILDANSQNLFEILRVPEIERGPYHDRRYFALTRIIRNARIADSTTPKVKQLWYRLIADPIGLSSEYKRITKLKGEAGTGIGISDSDILINRLLGEEKIVKLMSECEIPYSLFGVIYYRHIDEHRQEGNGRQETKYPVLVVPKVNGYIEEIVRWEDANPIKLSGYKRRAA